MNEEREDSGPYRKYKPSLRSLMSIVWDWELVAGSDFTHCPALLYIYKGECAQLEIVKTDWVGLG